MTKFNFFNKLKFSNKRFKLFILSLFALLILVPLLVFAFGTVDTGYPSLKNNGNNTIAVYWNTNNETELSKMQVSAGACVINNSGNDYFIPTRTWAEWSAFTSKMGGLGMTLTQGPGLPDVGGPPGSCQNGTCELAAGEACDNSPAECGTCGSACLATVSISGENYGVMQLQNQCWMSENLNVGNTGTIPPTNQSNNGQTQKYCYLNSISDYCTKGQMYYTGGLYQTGEAMNYSNTEKAQGICPSGWHIPSKSEWLNLNNDSRGMLALNTEFGGKYDAYSGVYKDHQNSGYYLSSTYSEDKTQSYQIKADYTLISTPLSSLNDAVSVRCLRNDPSQRYVLRYTAGQNGIIAGEEVQTVASGAQGTTVYAMPGANCHFEKWSDRTTTHDYSRSDIANAHLQVRAEFSCTSYTLTYLAGANGTITGAASQTVASQFSNTVRCKFRKKGMFVSLPQAESLWLLHNTRSDICKSMSASNFTAISSASLAS